MLLGEDGAPFLDRDKAKAYLINGPAWVNNHAHVLRGTAVTNRYLAHHLNSIDYRGLANGTTRLKLTQSSMNSIDVAVPPLAEQERIVAAIEEEFSRLDAGAAALERARVNLRRMRDAVLDCALSDAADSRSDEVRLGDVLREPLRNGYSAKASPAGTVRIWTLTAVTYGDFGLHNSKLTDADPRRVRGLWVQPGDILIERSNTPELVGTACMYRGAPDVAVYPDLIIRARLSPSVIPEYGELMLKTPAARRYFRGRAQGISGTMPKIAQGTIESFRFLLPPRDRQNEILERTNAQLASIDQAERSLIDASTREGNLRSSILTAAFSGQLVPQDPKDEPAAALLDRIAAARASSNGRGPTRTRRRPKKVTS